MALGKQDCVELGNLDARRDWGYAEEYVEGMWRMLQQEAPDTYVLATGRTQSIRDFAEMAAKAVQMELEWYGTGSDEYGVECGTNKVRVRVNPAFFRPSEVELLIGDATKAATQLHWTPKTTLEELCRMMVEADLHRNNR